MAGRPASNIQACAHGMKISWDLIPGVEGSFEGLTPKITVLGPKLVSR